MRYYRITPQGEFELSEEIGEAQFRSLVGDREPDETADFSTVKKITGDGFRAAHMLRRLGHQTTEGLTKDQQETGYAGVWRLDEGKGQAEGWFVAPALPAPV
jgi:hypothetical protein